jgi:2-polyprenyl-3-methyl-5-hydroxy-6-metoxy-1,4-benzoquinol methylase
MVEVQRGVRYAPEATVLRCQGCGLVFLWPRPSEAELAAYYAWQYRAQYDGVVSPENTHGKVAGEARVRVSRLLALVGPHADLLEIGASCGAFLEAARPHVRSVCGVELGDAHREWAERRLGVPMVRELAELGERRFHVIGLFHTLEHLPDPVGYLERLARFLLPSGVIAIEVPNVSDALLALYAIPAFAGDYFQRAHLYYFSAETLARTVRAAGGEAEISGVQRYDLSNHLRWMLTGRPGGQGHYRDVLSDEVQAAYAAALIRAGYSDTLWALARFESEAPR